MKKVIKYSPEVRERAVRMVLEHASEYASQWSAIQSIAAKVGCSAEAQRNWVRHAERDRADRDAGARGAGAAAGERDSVQNETFRI